MSNFNNMDKKNKSFMYQNLQKNNYFNTNFSKSNFNFACFRGAHMKSCKFNDCTFMGTEFMGTNLKESQFINAVFENAVFEGAKLDGVNFKGAVFLNTLFVSTAVESAFNLNSEDSGIRIFAEMPEIKMSGALKEIIEKLMQNAYIKRARVLDTKDKKMNTISVMILMEKFGEETLVHYLSKIEDAIDRDFYTLSYIIKMIEKLILEDKNNL